MLACDKCKRMNSKKTNTIFTKDESKKKVRTMLNIRIDLCEKCISKFMEQFGVFKFNFLKDKDESPTTG